MRNIRRSWTSAAMYSLFLSKIHCCRWALRNEENIEGAKPHYRIMVSKLSAGKSLNLLSCLCRALLVQIYVKRKSILTHKFWSKEIKALWSVSGTQMWSLNKYVWCHKIIFHVICLRLYDLCNHSFIWVCTIVHKVHNTNKILITMGEKIFVYYQVEILYLESKVLGPHILHLF